MATEAEVRLDKKIKNLQTQINSLVAQLRSRSTHSYPSPRTFAKNVVSSTSGDLLGTANQVIVVNGSDSVIRLDNVVLSLPQDINTGATPEFAGLVSTGLVDTSDLEVNSVPIEDMEVPIGGIIGWSGSILTIPTNYNLCDGTGGTPDLSVMFIV